MANEEHLRILKQGVDVWNKWKEANPDIEPDFSHADLRNIELNEALLKGANFCHANLSGVSLRYKDFDQADFSNANLSKARMGMFRC